MQTVKLGTLGTFQSGGTPKKSEPRFFGGKIPWISTTALDGAPIGAEAAATFLTDDALRHSAAKLVPAGSLLVGIRIGIGKNAVNRVPMATSQDIVAITGIDTDRWSLPYLMLFLEAARPRLQSLARGATIQGIQTGDIKNLDVPDLPLAEQQRIVRELQQVGALLANRRQVDEQLAELPKARFVEMFGDPVVNPMGWKVVHIKDICTVSSSKRLYQKDLTSSGIPFLKIADLVAKINGTPENPTSCLTERAYDDLRQQNAVPQANDILVTARGTLGLCYIVQPEDRFYFQDGMISWLRTSDARIEPVFLTTLFQLPIVRLQIQKVVTGSTIAYLSLEQLADFRVPLPPLPAQRRFAAFARACAAQRAACARQIAVLETLRGKLLQDAFGAAG